MTRVLIYLQHLLGLGHGARGLALGRALERQGCDVTFVSGGFPALGPDPAACDLIQLPPVRAADARYSTLLDPSGAAVDAAWRDARQKALLDAFETVRPDVLLIETFPFGRWPFRFELLPLLKTARPVCRIACSIRDILEPKSSARRNQSIIDLIDEFFDLVLVHGDPDLFPIEDSFGRAAEIKEKIRYTGYVVPAAPEGDDTDGTDEVIVSAGGGGTGAALFDCALEAARDDTRHWRFLVGPNCQAETKRRLAAATGIIVEPVRPDFRDLLARGDVSLSQAGYNTTLDILGARARAVVVPFAGHGETEQTRRAEHLAERNLLDVLPEARLTPDSLRGAIEARRAQPRPPVAGIDLDGAARSA